MQRFESEFGIDMTKKISQHEQYCDLFYHVVKLERSALIFDLGSETVKVGYSCETFLVYANRHRSYFGLKLLKTL